MKHITISVLYLFILFCLSVFVFEPAHLYYEIWWLDIPMHVMGGFGVASLVGAILSYRGKKVSYKRLFLGYLTVALVWEIYEYVNALPSLLMWGGWFDTGKDLIDGAIGMSIAYLFVRK